MRHAQACEDAALYLLEGEGYEVLGRQVRTDFAVTVDGTPVVVELRADYIVEKGDRRFVAEVKSGRLAPRIETATTRRQLLEYRVAFDVDGVLLVDGESEEVREVVFEGTSRLSSEPRAGFAWFVAGVALGAAATIVTLGLSTNYWR
jgi:hypothetical protein